MYVFNMMGTRLVDDITYTAATKGTNGLTASAILGPFYREDHPIRKNGTTISFDTPKDAQVSFMHGTVTDADTGKPLANAEIDIWQASTNGRRQLKQKQDKTNVVPRSVRAAGPRAAGPQPARQVHHRLRGPLLAVLPAPNSLPGKNWLHLHPVLYMVC